MPVLPTVQRRGDPSNPRLARAVATIAVAISVLATVVGVASGQASTTPSTRVDLRVLVLSDEQSPVPALAAALDREGVPFTELAISDESRPTIDAAFLTDTAGDVERARFQAVIVPRQEPSGLRPGELEALHDFERRFGVRQVNAYEWPNANVGLDIPVRVGPATGAVATVTAAGRSAGFGYLDGPVSLDPHSWSYLARPLAEPAPGTTFTSLVDFRFPDQADTGSLMGVYQHADGREELVITASHNEHQLHGRALAHGIITWATRGVHLGLQRSYLAVHIDDVFLPDDRWHIDGNCTVGDGCPPELTGTDIRMTADDVAFLRSWQQRTGLKLDIVFNAGGSDEAIATNGSDALTDAFLTEPSQYRWINHTYEHPNLGCEQDESQSPWRCVTDGSGAELWMGEAEITRQIAENQRWAVAHGIPMDPTELVTGEHSGLRVVPQHDEDNPNLAPALRTTGIRVIASDNSRESHQRMIGDAVTLPRYPMNIFYNVATEAEQVDEYNWIYASRDDGGSGICDDNPSTTTCLPAPLDLATGFDGYLVPLESSMTLARVLGNDPRPHFAHQSNLAEDRILYPVVDAVIDGYRSMYSDDAPILQPTMTEAAELLTRQSGWRKLLAEDPGAVTAYVQDGQLRIESSRDAAEIPVTVPASMTVLHAGWESYGGEQSQWLTIDRGTTALTQAPATDPPPTTTTPPVTTPPTTAPPASVPPTTVPPTMPAPARSGYWLLDASGTVYGFGDAKARVWGHAAVGASPAVDLEPTPRGDGYWIVDRSGRVHAFGKAVHRGGVTDLRPDEHVTSLSSTASGNGYWLFTNRGRVVPVGDAAFRYDAVGRRDMAGVALNGPVLDSVTTTGGNGYYMVASDGGIFSFGNAAFHGSMGGERLNEPVVSMAPDPDGRGYWLVASDGGTFSFEAPFRGSIPGVLAPGKRLNRPIVGMTPYGDGYLLLGADGGVFNFSDKPFEGSLGANPPRSPVVAVAPIER